MNETTTSNNAENLAKEIETMDEEQIKKLYWIVKGMELVNVERNKDECNR